MAHFAKLGINNEVIDILTMDTIDTMTKGGIEKEEIGVEHLKKHTGHETWKKCSYNTNAGVHRLGGTPFRATYPSIGYFYDSDNDIFKEPVPKDKDGDTCTSWVLNKTTGRYVPPITRPTVTQEQNDARKNYAWDESLYQSDNTKGWLEVDIV